MIQKILFVTMLTLAVLGMADAILLTVMHYSESSAWCPATGGCDKVNKSIYAEFLYVPTALWGLLFYVLVFILAIFAFKKYYLILFGKYLQARWALFGLLTAGLFVSLILVYLQLFALKSICLYCMLSAGNIFILFLLSLLPEKWTVKTTVPQAT